MLDDYTRFLVCLFMRTSDARPYRDVKNVGASIARPLPILIQHSSGE